VTARASWPAATTDAGGTASCLRLQTRAASGAPPPLPCLPGCCQRERLRTHRRGCAPAACCFEGVAASRGVPRHTPCRASAGPGHATLFGGHRACGPPAPARRVAYTQGAFACARQPRGLLPCLCFVLPRAGRDSCYYLHLGATAARAARLGRPRPPVLWQRAVKPPHLPATVTRYSVLR
jgi:hypothetical protein